MTKPPLTYKTKNGTTLPLLDLRGKPYLQVMWRLVWFREEHPTWTIKTSVTYDIEKQHAVGMAWIINDKGDTLATGHKFENAQGFADYIEKAETGAIGRALALCGYGTQFCADELDEGERIVDSPVVLIPAGAPLVPPNPKATMVMQISALLTGPNGVDPKEVAEFYKSKFGKQSSNELSEDELKQVFLYAKNKASIKAASARPKAVQT